MTGRSDDLRERLIVLVAKTVHETTSHPDYPSYDEVPCCGTPAPALVNPTLMHHEAGHEKGSRGVCWSCEPGAAAAVDALLPIVAARVKAAKVEALREAADDFATGAWAEAFLTGEVVDDESAVRATEAWFLARADRIEEDQ